MGIIFLLGCAGEDTLKKSAFMCKLVKDVPLKILDVNRSNAKQVKVKLFTLCQDRNFVST